MIHFSIDDDSLDVTENTYIVVGFRNGNGAGGVYWTNMLGFEQQALIGPLATLTYNYRYNSKFTF